MELLIVYLLYWTIWGIVHSILATDTVKKRFNSTIYRICYNIFATLTFIYLITYLPSLSALIFKIFTLNLNKFIIVSIIGSSGAIVTLLGLREWDLKVFMGIKKENEELTTTGIYALSRHPVYTGVILILASLCIIEISITSISWFIGVTGYFIAGSFPEERKLLQAFGKKYQEYKINVGRFFPYKITHIKYLQRHLHK